MRHVTGLELTHLDQPSVVTIGAFDGVHRGHQYLIQHLLDRAQMHNEIPVVLTFFPLPKMVLGGFQCGFYLTLPDDKARLLGNLGVEVVITHPFNDDVRQMRAATFVDLLVEHLNMRSLWVGEDFALGYQREGNVTFLKAAGAERGFDVQVVDLMDAGHERVSSTRIRNELAEGNVAEAGRLLGRPHFVRGEVVTGAHRGHTLGFPTANLAVSELVAIPARGVYAGWMRVRGETHEAVINIGLRPTFDGRPTETVEAHLLDFSGDLYGEEVALFFSRRLRGEQKFGGADELIEQIRADIQTGRVVLREEGPPKVAV
jgi:riboflavin kinase/FMN adenylyltransferase